METWKDIPDTNYCVSDLGRVKNKFSDFVLKPWNRGEYLAVNLGFHNPHYLHKLVADAFLQKIEGFDIDHINRDKHDNRLSNLRYVSKSQNRCNVPCLITNRLQQRNISFNGSSYCVRIYRNGKYALIKNYTTLEEAIKARDNFINSNY